MLVKDIKITSENVVFTISGVGKNVKTMKSCITFHSLQMFYHITRFVLWFIVYLAYHDWNKVLVSLCLFTVKGFKCNKSKKLVFKAALSELASNKKLLLTFSKNTLNVWCSLKTILPLQYFLWLTDFAFQLLTSRWVMTVLQWAVHRGPTRGLSQVNDRSTQSMALLLIVHIERLQESQRASEVKSTVH